MKSTIQKMLRLFRGKTVCVKCRYMVDPNSVMGNTEEGCGLAYVIEQFWIPTDEINPDGKCTDYRKR